MPLHKRFEDAALHAIVDEALVYQCSCPAQVAEQIVRLRKLYVYQEQCVEKLRADPTVHDMIARGAEAAHAALEETLDRVLDVEGWDRESWRMPQGLRDKRDRETLADS